VLSRQAVRTLRQTGYLGGIVRTHRQEDALGGRTHRQAGRTHRQAGRISGQDAHADRWDVCASSRQDA
jgi:hypothetical protein